MNVPMALAEGGVVNFIIIGGIPILALRDVIEGIEATDGYE